MATTLTDQLPDRQRAALEHFEGLGCTFTHTTAWAGGLLVVVTDDDATEIEIDDLGCYSPANPTCLAADARDRPGNGA